MKPIIRVENLGKQYRIGERETAYATLRETLTRAAKAPLNRIRKVWQSGIEGLRRSNGRGSRDGHRANRFWALKEVNFEVPPGEVLGIIGRNGAGKSTLLKILSRITEPTAGQADLYGRVGSLLEVGTGFHYELTGRENTFLNGAILGMGRREIERKFDEIVDFAGISEFIDTPVKRYSSGMYVRLAFAVAAHLDTEILLVDEVLAVGDAAFQRRCFAKMQQVRSGGRTIVFVSHNMSAVRRICTVGMLLDRGVIRAWGDINAVADEYLASTTSEDGRMSRAETASFVVHQATICSPGADVIKPFGPVEVRVDATAKTDIRTPGLYLGFLTLEGLRIAGLDLRDFCSPPLLRAGRTAQLGFLIESLPLLPGTYHCELYLKDPASQKAEQVPQLLQFEVAETPVYGGRKLNYWFGSVGLKAAPVYSIGSPSVQMKT